RVLTPFASGATEPKGPRSPSAPRRPLRGDADDELGLVRFHLQQEAERDRDAHVRTLGPTASTGACCAPTASGSKDSRSGKAYSDCANGSYTFTNPYAYA